MTKVSVSQTLFEYLFFTGTQPELALQADLSGNQNDGWSALVSPDEIEDVHVETKRLLMVSARERFCRSW